MDPNINYKNKLQEYFQKNKLELPIYTYKSYDNNKKWEACIKLPDCDELFYGDIDVSKVKTAQSGAYKAYMMLLENDNVDNEHLNIPFVDVEKQPLDKIMYNKTNEPTYILVDFENVPHTDKIENLIKNNDNFTLIKFASINHSNLHMVDYVIPTTTKDATDHYIGIYLGMLISTIKKKINIYILTKDHFGEVLEIIYQKINNPNICVKHFTNQNYVVKYINENHY